VTGGQYPSQASPLGGENCTYRVSPIICGCSTTYNTYSMGGHWLKGVVNYYEKSMENCIVVKEKHLKM